MVVKLMDSGSPSMSGVTDEQMDEVIHRMTGIAVGPFGGEGGTNWDDGKDCGILEIALRYGDVIDSISFVYEKNGKPIQSEKHGGNGGSATALIILDFPHEYLVGFSGNYSTFEGYVVFTCLTFKTNRRTFGPYGKETGAPFSFPMDGGKIAGFRGRSGSYLNAIGFHLSPL